MQNKKLTSAERQALTLMRKLHARQREKLLARMRRDVLANKVVAKAANVRKIEIMDDRSIERSFGVVPTWRSK